MVHAARASTRRATTPSSPRHFPIPRSGSKIASNSPENSTLNSSNRPKSARSNAPFATHNPPLAAQKINHHQLLSPLPANSNRHKLQLESSVTSRKQTTAPNSNRHKFCPKSAPALQAPAITTQQSPTTPFLFNTNKPHRIIILIRPLQKTKEKQFSIRYKCAIGSIGDLACALRFCIGAPRNQSNQIKCAQARLPMLPSFSGGRS